MAVEERSYESPRASSQPGGRSSACRECSVLDGLGVFLSFKVFSLIRLKVIQSECLSSINVYHDLSLFLCFSFFVVALDEIQDFRSKSRSKRGLNIHTSIRRHVPGWVWGRAMGDVP